MGWRQERTRSEGVNGDIGNHYRPPRWMKCYEPFFFSAHRAFIALLILAFASADCLNFIPGTFPKVGLTVDFAHRAR
jgi:hypothetical protein